MKRTAADIRSDIQTTVQAILDGDEGAPFPALFEEAEEKAVAILHVLRRQHSERLAGKAEQEIATKYVRDRDRTIDRLEMELTLTLEAMGTNKIDRPDGRVTMIPPKPVLVVDDEKLVPAEYFRVIPESRALDKVPLLAAAKLKDIPGVRVGEGKPGIRYDKPKGEVS